jgi:hypothetical protein
VARDAAEAARAAADAAKATADAALDLADDPVDAFTKAEADVRFLEPIQRLDREIGQPAAVTVHTDLVTYIGQVDARVAALEHSPEPPIADAHLVVDNYGGGFIRLLNPPDAGTIDVALATVPGPNGAIYPTLGDIPGAAAVWVDYGGTLGKAKTAIGADVLGSTLKEWIRRQSILTIHKDTTDPAHPAMVVDLVTDPTAPGSSLTLGNLKNTDDATDAAAVGSVLGVTAPGVWGPVALEARLAALEARLAALEGPP